MSNVQKSAQPTWGFEGDSLETKIARAMYGSTVHLVREHASKVDVQHDRLRKVFETARVESDRSSAILIFALAEDLMLDAMKRYLKGEIKGGWDELIGGNGLLATANDRITLLSLLNWIHPVVYSDLRLLKSIRNRFAHHAEIQGFDDSVIKNWILAMNASEAAALDAVADAEDLRVGALNARQLFLIRSALVITRMVANLAVAPEARSSRVAPGHVEGESWDEYPENLKGLFRLSAEIIMAVTASAEERAQ